MGDEGMPKSVAGYLLLATLSGLESAPVRIVLDMGVVTLSPVLSSPLI